MKKIKKIIIAAYICIPFAFIISLLLSLLIFVTKLNLLFKVVIFFIVFIFLMVIFGYFINKYFCKKLKTMQQESKVISIPYDLSTPSDKKILIYNGKDYILYKKKRFLDTLSAIHLENCDTSEAKRIIRNVNKYIKKNFKEANETNPTKCHWNLKINMLITNGKINIDEMVIIIENLNNEQLFEIGKFTFGYSNELKVAIVPVYRANDLNIISLRKYIKSIRIICNFFGCPPSLFFEKL